MQLWMSPTVMMKTEILHVSVSRFFEERQRTWSNQTVAVSLPVNLPTVASYHERFSAPVDLLPRASYREGFGVRGFYSWRPRLPFSLTPTTALALHANSSIVESCLSYVSVRRCFSKIAGQRWLSRPSQLIL